jgi:hypothetical protein
MNAETAYLAWCLGQAANLRDGHCLDKTPREVDMYAVSVRRRSGVACQAAEGPAQSLLLLSSALKRSAPECRHRCRGMICSTTKMIAASRACLSLRPVMKKQDFRIRPLRAALRTSREVHSEVLTISEQLRLQTAMMLSVQKQKGSYQCSTNYSRPLR